MIFPRFNPCKICDTKIKFYAHVFASQNVFVLRIFKAQVLFTILRNWQLRSAIFWKFFFEKYQLHIRNDDEIFSKTFFPLTYVGFARPSSFCSRAKNVRISPSSLTLFRIKTVNIPLSVNHRYFAYLEQAGLSCLAGEEKNNSKRRYKDLKASKDFTEKMDQYKWQIQWWWKKRDSVNIIG